jgi:riboflavin synthase
LTLGELFAGSRSTWSAPCVSAIAWGHLVSGHVDAIATISERVQDRNAVRFTFRLPASVNRFIAEKGSVAIDGISLTVNAVTDETFAVAIIPHTLAMTTLQEKKNGDRVNIETDLIARYIARLLGVEEAQSKIPQPRISCQARFSVT